MGFFTLLLLGAIFVGSNGQNVVRQDQDFRQLQEQMRQLQEPMRQLQEPMRQLQDPMRQLQEPMRQLQEPIRRISSQYDRNVQNGLSLTSQPQQQMPSQYQMQAQKSHQLAATQQLPKPSGESSTSVDKPRQSLETQEQALYAQEILKNDELAKKQSGSRGVTVCVQVHSAHGDPVVCGPQISSGPALVQSYKSPQQPQQQQKPLPQDRPAPNPSFIPAPVRQQALMRVPVYNSYIPARDYAPPRQPLVYNCKPESPSPLTRFTNDYRLASAVPIPAEYGFSLGLNGESRQTMLPDGTISPYNWGAPLSRSGSQLPNSDQKLRNGQLDLPLDRPGSQLRTSDTPFMNYYDESLAKSIDDVMRASENAASSTSYMSTVPGYEKSNDQSALQRLEESREKLRKLTKELEEVKKSRAAEEALKAEEQKQLTNQQQQQQQQAQLKEEERKRIASSQEPLRPAQIGEREIRQ